MTAPNPPSLPALIRYWLGTDRIKFMEEQMASAKVQLENLTARFDDFTTDVRAALATLTAERENLSADAQGALDTLNAKLEAADAEVGDADGSDTPTPPPAEPSEF